MASNHPYIAVEGVIGVGKTTLARLLQPRFEAETILEAFDENPFLSDFYEDRFRYAFQTQLFFLLSRYRQQQRAAQSLGQRALLSDYFFEKDRLFAHLNIQSPDELEMYDRLYEALAEKVRKPDLVVYLRARVDTLMARIAMRDRTYERQMDRGYIEALRLRYEHLFSTYDEIPLLVIESDDLDFVRHPDDLDAIEHRIRSTLAGVWQPTLPKISLDTPPRPAWKLVSAPAVEPRTEANWQALGDFLALAEAVGRIGGALAQQAPVGPDGPPEPVRVAMRDVHRALRVLAQRTGVELEYQEGNASTETTYPDQRSEL
ncbi:MAG: deoxynucleoside kinase [Anaerolineae bacterium]